MNKTFCDHHKGELTGENVGQKGHDVEWNGTMIHVVLNPPCDLCLDCLLELITKKPKRKYERKAKSETVTVVQDVTGSVFMVDLTGTNPLKEKPVANEELIIQTATEETPTYGVNILGRMAYGLTLREAVKTAIAREPAWENQIPKSLSKKNTALLQNILEEK